MADTFIVDVSTSCGTLGESLGISFFGLAWVKWKQKSVADLVRLMRQICGLRKGTLCRLLVENDELDLSEQDAKLASYPVVTPNCVITAILCDPKTCICSNKDIVLNTKELGKLDPNPEGEKRKRGRPISELRKKLRLAADQRASEEDNDNDTPGHIPPLPIGTLAVTPPSGRGRGRWGGVLCPHGRKKYLCPPCGGQEPCPHGRQMNRCKDCGGASICMHKRPRQICKECGGASVCPHKKLKQYCRECKGSAYCPHGRQKHVCRECGGKSICIHNRQRSLCKDCGGTSICDHGRRRYTCKDCGGKAVCVHGKQRVSCKECNGDDVPKKKKNGLNPPGTAKSTKKVSNPNTDPTVLSATVVPNGMPGLHPSGPVLSLPPVSIMEPVQQIVRQQVHQSQQVVQASGSWTPQEFMQHQNYAMPTSQNQDWRQGGGAYTSNGVGGWMGVGGPFNL